MRKAYYLRHYDPAPCPPLEENATYNLTGQYLDDCEVLEVDAYDFNGELAFRHFIDFTKMVYWTYSLVEIYAYRSYGRPFTIGANEWTQASIDTIFDGGRMVEYGDHCSMTKELKLWIYHEVEESVRSSQYWGSNGISRLEAWERIAQAHQLERKRRVRLENIRGMFRDLPDREDEILWWSKANLLPHYALTATLQKSFRITCTVCGKTWRRKLKPPKNTVCPHCVTSLTTTRKKRVREKVRVYETEPFADGGIIRHYDIFCEWKQDGGCWGGGTEIEEVQRALIGRDGKWKKSFWINGYTEEEGYVFADSKGYGNYITNGRGYLYPNGVFYPNRTDTDLRIYKILADRFHKSDWNEVEFKASSIPDCTEYLIKSGLMKMAKEVIHRSRWEEGDEYREKIREALDMDAVSIPGLLGVDGNMAARLKRLDISLGTLKFIQDHPGRYSDRTIINLEEVGVDNLMLSETGLTIRKAANYLARQKEKGGFSSIEETKSIYADYIRMAIRRGMDPHDDIVRRCSDLRRRHDELAAERDMEKQEERFKKCRGVSDLYKPYCAVYGWTDGDYTVAVPSSPKEIFKEGQILHHCVGREGAGYIERHAEGKTLILFLRPADKDKEPWYTLEVDPYEMRVVQKYSKFDRQPELEVVNKELAKWRKAVSRRLSKPTKEVRAALARIKELVKEESWKNTTR